MKKSLFITALPILISCGSNKYLSSSVSPNEITELHYFKPSAFVHYVEKGNVTKLSDSLSAVTASKLDSLLTLRKTELKLKDKINIASGALNEQIANEMEYLVKTIAVQRKLDDIPLTPAIDSILDSKGKRFALATVAAGFGRRKGNYGGQVAKGAAIGILTLGLYTPIPIKSSLSLYGLIFDAEENTVAFYGKTNPTEKSPTATEEIDKQLSNLFKGYFYDK